VGLTRATIAVDEGGVAGRAGGAGAFMTASISAISRGAREIHSTPLGVAM